MQTQMSAPCLCEMSRPNVRRFAKSNGTRQDCPLVKKPDYTQRQVPHHFAAALRILCTSDSGQQQVVERIRSELS